MDDFRKLKWLWEERKKLQLSSFVSQKISEAGVLFLMSSSDWGVCRNGGRRGSRFAPDAIANALKKMVSRVPHQSLYFEKVSCLAAEEENFAQAQEESAHFIQKVCDQFKGNTIFHIGGGHDHIFPLLMSFRAEKAIHVINIDAHLDTRLETLPHSGTPFRQFADLYRGHFRLTQMGIHPFANESSSYKDLSAEMVTFSVDELSDRGAELEKKISFNRNELTLLSLDCDALASESMEAVSAVNPEGLSFQYVKKVFNFYRKLDQDKKIYGIYEYNPLFDNLSQKGAKCLASLIYNAF